MVWAMKFKSKTNSIKEYSLVDQDFMKDDHSYLRYLSIENNDERIIIDIEKLKIVDHNIPNFERLSYLCKLPIVGKKRIATLNSICLSPLYYTHKSILAYQGKNIPERKITLFTPRGKIVLVVGKTPDHPGFRSYCNLVSYPAEIKQGSGLMITYQNYQSIDSLFN